MAMEVFTTKDKSQRDRMFQELRSSKVKVQKLVKGEMVEVEVPHPLESQVVKFSDVEAVVNDKGQVYRKVQYPGKTLDGGSGGKLQFRPIFISTWSVAYPTN